MRIQLTPTNSLILGPIFLVGGVVMLATGTTSFQSVGFCVIGVFLLIGGIVRLTASGDDVASERLQRRRRERFGRGR